MGGLHLDLQLFGSGFWLPKFLKCFEFRVVVLTPPVALIPFAISQTRRFLFMEPSALGTYRGQDAYVKLHTHTHTHTVEALRCKTGFMQ
jgi:hypothetical protein